MSLSLRLLQLLPLLQVWCELEHLMLIAGSCIPNDASQMSQVLWVVLWAIKLNLWGDKAQAPQ